MCLCFSLFLIFPTVFHVLKDPQIIYIFGIGTHQVLVDLHWQPTNDDSIPGASKSVFSKIKTREFLHLFREAFHVVCFIPCSFIINVTYQGKAKMAVSLDSNWLFVVFVKNLQTLECQDPPAAATCKGCRPSESASTRFWHQQSSEHFMK